MMEKFILQMMEMSLLLNEESGERSQVSVERCQESGSQTCETNLRA